MISFVSTQFVSQHVKPTQHVLKVNFAKIISVHRNQNVSPTKIVTSMNNVLENPANQSAKMSASLVSSADVMQIVYQETIKPNVNANLAFTWMERRVKRSNVTQTTNVAEIRNAKIMSARLYV